MIYYSKNVRGSDGYWRAKKAELYTWINYHVDMGHGAPTLFVTLSCAEYFWPDLKRLLEERIYAAESRVVDLDKKNSERNRAVNNYSIVVQEFFQMRCRDYLDTVCKDLFKIKHYWCRFEFEKSRGQIHAHLLAITEDSTDKDGINTTLHKHKDDKDRQAELLFDWASKTFGLTSMHPGA